MFQILCSVTSYWDWESGPPSNSPLLRSNSFWVGIKVSYMYVIFKISITKLVCVSPRHNNIFSKINFKYTKAEIYLNGMYPFYILFSFLRVIHASLQNDYLCATFAYIVTSNLHISSHVPCEA